ncbi:general secretion pathway protein GspN [Luteimonas yindakuii]|uniref:general secretion pathway protein GspN n=1 Tax=Luteimonas yindakuii TaxID=2565782 RepID=UPI0010A346A0|nr:general secretion pathway protein GspN [Luteimonas yindakuii]QCO68410.1 general secretion pathway protein GspN [Luteimonas yindakuii]
MRLDQAGTSTGLLAAVALWAVLLWLLALAGLGSRVGTLPDDASLLQPLPQAGDPPAERLGPLPQYAAIGDRPLFAEDRRHRPFVLDGGGSDEAGTPDFDVVLTSVLITPSLQMAIVQPREGGDALRVRVGDAPRGFGNWALRSVSPRAAVFAGPDGERVLELRVYDGRGGQPPTPASAVPQPSVAALPVPPSPPWDRTRAPARQQAEQARTAAPPAQPAQPPQAGPVEAGDSPPREADPTPASQAEAIRRRIEARRARLQAERATQPAEPVESPQ